MYKHYAKTDEQGRVVDAWSTAIFPDKDTAGAVLLQTDGYQFRIGEEESPALYSMDGIALYKLVGGEIVPRKKAEIDADRALIPEPLPSKIEQLRADVDFIAALGGVEL